MVPVSETQTFQSHGELVPTKTTNTAAYVAVAASVSVLLARMTSDMAAANSVTAILTVTRLFVFVWCSVMMSIGTTRLAPPANAMMNLASL
jgi:hypothetical protein